MVRIELEISHALLRRIDNAAEDADETRDQFLRRIFEAEVVRSEGALREEIEEMLGPPIPMGGDSAKIIREMRDGRIVKSHPRRADED